LAVWLVTVGCGGPGASQAPPSEVTRAIRPEDREVFYLARRSLAAPTWDASLEILGRVEREGAYDPDVVAYVSFNRRCAQLARQLGLVRKRPPAGAQGELPPPPEFKAFAAALLDAAGKRLPRLAPDVAKQIEAVDFEAKAMDELDGRLAERYAG
jgi:hypothetical protein